MNSKFEAVGYRFDAIDSKLASLRSDFRADLHCELRLQFAAMVAIILTVAGFLHFG